MNDGRLLPFLALAGLLAAKAATGSRGIVRRSRSLLAPFNAGRAASSLEIYLDSSGSMPSSGVEFACELAREVIAIGGRVRGVVWSSGPSLIQREWLEDPRQAEAFFSQRLIGGSDDGWLVDLHQLMQDPPPDLGTARVLITDSDLIRMADKKMLTILGEASKKSTGSVPSLGRGMIVVVLGQVYNHSEFDQVKSKLQDIGVSTTWLPMRS
jgi:hypothetical protein